MFGEMLRVEKQEKQIPYRERTSVWKSIVERGVEKALVDDIIERVTASPNELYSFSLESKFREKIRVSATEAIDELLRNNQKNFSDPIDKQTSKWDREIADSSEDPDEEISNRGDALMKSLITLAGGKANLIEKVVTIMIDQEKQKKTEGHKENLQ